MEPMGIFRLGKAGWARCVKNRKGRVRWGMAVMDGKGTVWRGTVRFGRAVRVGNGRDGFGLV
jgi:hypothetical protein